jgi:hypothetical protein
MNDKNNVPTNESEFYNENTINKDIVRTRNATFHNRTPMVEKTYPTDKFDQFGKAICETKDRTERTQLANSRSQKSSKPQSINKPKSGPQGASKRT